MLACIPHSFVCCTTTAQNLNGIGIFSSPPLSPPPCRDNEPPPHNSQSGKNILSQQHPKDLHSYGIQPRISGRVESFVATHSENHRQQSEAASQNHEVHVVRSRYSHHGGRSVGNNRASGRIVRSSAVVVHIFWRRRVGGRRGGIVVLPAGRAWCGRDVVRRIGVTGGRGRDRGGLRILVHFKSIKRRR